MCNRDAGRAPSTLLLAPGPSASQQPCHPLCIVELFSCCCFTQLFAQDSLLVFLVSSLCQAQRYRDAPYSLRHFVDLHIASPGDFSLSCHSSRPFTCTRAPLVHYSEFRDAIDRRASSPCSLCPAAGRSPRRASARSGKVSPIIFQRCMNNIDNFCSSLSISQPVSGDHRRGFSGNWNCLLKQQLLGNPFTSFTNRRKSVAAIPSQFGSRLKFASPVCTRAQAIPYACLLTLLYIWTRKRAVADECDASASSSYSGTMNTVLESSPKT